MSNIHKALQKIQTELKAPKNRNNTFGKYKYRSCEDIEEALKPHLIENNCSLFLSDDVKHLGDVLFIEATAKLVHIESGESVEVKSSAGIDINKKGMDTSQTFGASSSYARKYALNGMFLIDDSKDADSDEYHHQVNAQQQRQPKKQSISSERFWKAVESIKAGSYTKQQLISSFELTPQQISELDKI